MAKRTRKEIVWVKTAHRVFTKTLEFWTEHNQSSAYSRKLDTQIKNLLQQIALYPNLGKATSKNGVQVVVKDHYHIYYRVTSDQIIVQIFWASRRNPAEFKL